MNPILIDLPMPIRTARLLIKPREYGEGSRIAEAANESLPELSPWMPWASETLTAEAAEVRAREHMAEYILRTSFALSLYTPDGKTFIGSSGFHDVQWDVRRFEIGYWIRTSFSGRGLVTEAVNALTRYLFEVLGARRVEIRCDAENAASLAIMRKLGFATEAHFKNEDIGTDGRPRDTVVSARYGTNGLPGVAGLSWASPGESGTGR